jgi:hypothetical protein
MANAIQWYNDSNVRVKRVKYTGSSTIYEGMPLCYSYISTDNWTGWGAATAGASKTEQGTTAEGEQNEGKYIYVETPVEVNAESVIPADGSAVLTAASGDDEDFNNLQVGMWVTITGTDVTNGTYKVTAVTQGVEDTTQGTITLDTVVGSGTTEDVTVKVNNKPWLAGFVAGTEKTGQSGPCELDIYIPNGAIIPVRTDASCTVGVTVLGLESGQTEMGLCTGDNDPIGCAWAMETVDRSSVAGLVLAKVWPTGQVIVGNAAYFAPSNYRNGRTYGFTIDGSNFFNGVAGAQEYLFQVVGDKSVAASGDCYGGLCYIKGNNYAANASTYILRGLNVSINNRSGGTVGTLTNNISAATKSGSTTGTLIGCQIDCQHQAGTDNPDEIGGLDVSLNYEGGEATLEYGIQVRTRGSVNVAVDHVFYISKGTDYGFTNLFGFDAGSTVGMTTSDGGVSTHKIPILDGTTTRYLMVSDG